MELFVVQVQQESLRLEQHDFMKPLEYNLESSSDIKSLVSFALYVKGKNQYKYRSSCKLFIETDVGKTNTYS